MIFVVSESWPEDIRAALRSAARPRHERASDVARPPMLAMPTGELAGAWLVAAAVARHVGCPPEFVTAVGDCAPAGRAVDTLCSASAQMRVLTKPMAGLCRRWLSVDVPREVNTSADGLSHPDRAADITEATELLGWSVQRVRVPHDSDLWDPIRSAADERMGSELAEGDSALTTAVTADEAGADGVEALLRMEPEFLGYVRHCQREQYDTYVGRQCISTPTGAFTGWGNPHRQGGAGACVDAFAATILKDGALMDRVRAELPGRRLGCFCICGGRPARCHASILAAVANCGADVYTRLRGAAA